MRTIQLNISVTDFQKYNLKSNKIKFIDLVETINPEYARKALLQYSKIAVEVGL